MRLLQYVDNDAIKTEVRNRKWTESGLEVYREGGRTREIARREQIVNSRSYNHLLGQQAPLWLRACHLSLEKKSKLLQRTQAGAKRSEKPFERTQIDAKRSQKPCNVKNIATITYALSSIVVKVKGKNMFSVRKDEIETACKGLSSLNAHCWPQNALVVNIN